MLTKSNTSITFLISTVVISLVLILAGVGGYGFISVQHMRANIKELSERNVSAIKLLRDVGGYYANLSKAIDDFTSGQLPGKDAIDQIEQSLHGSDKEWKEYSATGIEGDEKGPADEYISTAVKIEPAIKEAWAAIQVGDKVKTGQLIPVLKPNFDKINDGMDKLIDIQHQQAEEIYTRSEESFKIISGAYAAAAVIVVLICIGTFLVVRGWIIIPLNNMAEAMTAIADEKYDTEIPNLGHNNELGILATALDIFLKNGIERQRLNAEQAEAARKQVERANHMDKLTKEFDASVSSMLGMVSSSADQMKGTAGSMASVAEEGSKQSQTAATAAQQASTNVQTVAAAAEELSASINEISSRIQQSNTVAQKAMEDAEQANTTVKGLSEAAGRIGSVVETINTIAAQINLLALNATIEAARAGDAGKGFAVVASEVKALANQTGKATEEISQQISNMQKATEDTVAVIHSVSSIIKNINEISANISAAVTEQGAATQEIARNVQQAAAGTTEVSSSIASVTKASSETGIAASQVLSAASELSMQSEKLRSGVDSFLSAVNSL